MADHELTGYNLSRAFWDFSFEHPDKVKPLHAAIFFFAIEHCNRLGWKEKFGLPTSMTLEAIGMKSYSSYKKAFDDLVEWGFIKVIEYSKNQYSSNIVALSKNVKALAKALDKATSKHTSKQRQSTSESTHQSTGESTVSIIKPLTINQEPLTIEQDFNKKNLADPLTDLEIGKTKEFWSITLSRNYSDEKISELWKAFCIQSEKKFYADRAEKINHFRNWIKTQPYDTDKRSTETRGRQVGGKSAGAHELLDRIKDDFTGLINTGG